MHRKFIPKKDPTKDATLIATEMGVSTMFAIKMKNHATTLPAVRFENIP